MRCSYCIETPPDKHWSLKDPKGADMVLCSLRCMACWAVMTALDPAKVRKLDGPAQEEETVRA
jgi:hypothetical protein